ncbi:hypothetical protein OVY01_11465 [Robbsia sp. Bb-Pol-6]|uniref:Uncharacterized protein n=1 Tax=Robbsia betulipollinis TaxID=2981849 RepID=A0ABT3ZMV7_9BURK|nr:hypothetical protein [Robbsia betulipollinis]MCY0387841.1 hypothetical protein [Robbsia betulipollinis]
MTEQDWPPQIDSLNLEFVLDEYQENGQAAQPIESWDVLGLFGKFAVKVNSVDTKERHFRVLNLE